MKAKIGIFMHFGPYAVPGLRTEWFWQNWVHNVPEVVNFMKDNYPPHFTYQDFGPQLTMEFFDPQWFADLVTTSGAIYLVRFSIISLIWNIVTKKLIRNGHLEPSLQWAYTYES